MPTSLVSEAPPSDLTDELAAAIRQASETRTQLRIVGGDTKGFYGRQVDGEPLSLSGHRGIIAYDPSELVITARAGTRLSEIEIRLAEHRQQLGFEPPRFGAASTIGGAVAAGLAGPRRPFAGQVRDSLLGAVILDGHGRRLAFGGQVFKNVAGFDAFRLQAGALGALGVIVEVSLRVRPAPRREVALSFEMSSDAARAWMTELLRRPIPLSGAFHDGARLHIRLSGGEAGVEAVAHELGGEADSLACWDDIRDHRHPALASETRLWRLSLPQTSPIPPIGDVLAWDWAGAQAWVRSGVAAAAIWDAAAAAGGHASLFRGAGAGEAAFQPLAPAMLALHRRLKSAFDPAGILNPGRMYEGL